MRTYSTLCNLKRRNHMANIIKTLCLLSCRSKLCTAHNLCGANYTRKQTSVIYDRLHTTSYTTLGYFHYSTSLMVGNGAAEMWRSHSRFLSHLTTQDAPRAFTFLTLFLERGLPNISEIILPQQLDNSKTTMR